MVRALFSGRLRDALTKANGAFIGAQSWRNGHKWKAKLPGGLGACVAGATSGSQQ